MGFLASTNDYQPTNPGNDPRVTQQYQQFVNNQGNQNALATHLQSVMNGGTSPAQQQYLANVGNIQRQQSGAIASQKGISPALAAMMTSQQGGQAMQNAAGQGAAIQANEQVGAMGALNSLYNSMGNQSIQQQGVTQQGNLAYQNLGANISGQNASMQNQMTGGAINAIGGAGAMLAMAKGGKVPHPITFLGGGGVPGRANVPGDSLKNDTVDAKLSPGEIVIPRSLVHNPGKAKSFIEAINAKESRPKHYGDVLKTRRQLKKQKDGSFA